MRGDYGLNQFFGSTCQIMQAVNSNPLLNRVYALFSAESPQIVIKVNREKMASLRVSFDSAMQSFSINFGGAYVNKMFQEYRKHKSHLHLSHAPLLPEIFSCFHRKPRKSSCISTILTTLASYPPSNSVNFELLGVSGRRVPYCHPWQQVVKGES